MKYVDLVALMESMVEEEVNALASKGAFAPLMKEEAQTLRHTLNAQAQLTKLVERSGGDWSTARKLYAKRALHKSLTEAYQHLPGTSPEHGGLGVRDPKVQAYARVLTETAVERFDMVSARCGFGASK